ncbi:MAG: hypothetical protein WBV82_22885 [Myxococcaceae bacterium]
MSPRRGILHRFEKIERKRQPRPTGPDAGPTERSRFEAIQTGTGAPPEETSSSGAALERFEAPEPRPLALHEKREEDQPFTRCAACEADNSRYVSVCARCGERLDTPEQRAFNEALWAQRREAQLAEQAQQRDFVAARAQDLEEAARAKRAYYESLARQVRAETESRIEGDDGTWVTLSRWVRHHLGLGGVWAALVIGGGFFVLASMVLLVTGGPGVWLRSLPILVVVAVGIGLRSAKFT